MKIPVVIVAVCAGLAIAQTPAPVVTDNEAGITYSAQLTSGIDATLTGSVTGTTSTNRSGVQFEISFSGFNLTSNYTYHIHQSPVPANGDCNATGEHLDPTQLGPPTNKNYVCDPSQPQLCQVGDSSGKHGVIHNAVGLAAVYIDEYLSTTPGDAAFFGNRSVVVHLASNNLRLKCGNFTLDGPYIITAIIPSSTVSTGPTASASVATVSTTVTDQAFSTPTSRASATTPTSSASVATFTPAASAGSERFHFDMDLLLLMLAVGLARH